MLPYITHSNRLALKALLLFYVLVIAACAPAPAQAIVPTATSAPTTVVQPTTKPGVTALPRATPYAQLPAAGICAEPVVEVVTITINADIPDPRCTVLKAAQKLRVANTSGKTIKVRIGLFEAELADGAGQLFDAPVGTYLLQGVHQLLVEPCCSPELWLK